MLNLTADLEKKSEQTATSPKPEYKKAGSAHSVSHEHRPPSQDCWVILTNGRQSNYEGRCSTFNGCS